jgi:tetratricopeptide (TPR) repeat protein
MGILHRYFSSRAEKVSPVDLRRQHVLTLQETVLRHSQAGRFAEALPPAEELIAVLRDVANTTEEAWPWPGLGTILSDKARILRGLGRGEDAIGCANEALRIWLTLAAHEPLYLRHLAASLVVLSQALNDGGRTDEAAEAARQAARQIRGLVPADPARFVPDLANALNDLGVFEGKIGNPDAAVAAAEEAVTLFRDLHTKDVSRYRPLLAGALNNLGAALRKAGRFDAALAAMEESVGFYRQVLAFKPEAAQPHIGAVLANRGLVFRDLGRRTEALASLQEAVVVGRSIAQRDPGRRADLAESLRALADLHDDAGHAKKALDAVDEAIRIWMELSETEPKRHTGPLADALGFAALRFTDIHDAQSAARLAAMSVELNRVRVVRNRNAHLSDLADSLITLTHALNCGGAWDRAQQPAAEAVMLWREMSSVDTAKILRCSIAEGMNALVLSHLGRHGEAAAMLGDSLKRLGATPDRWIAADRTLVAHLLGDYVAVCREGKIAPDPSAVRPFENAITLH